MKNQKPLFKAIKIAPLFLLLLSGSYCSKKKSNGCNNCGNQNRDQGGPGNGQLQLQPTLDLQGGSGLVVVDNQTKTGGNLTSGSIFQLHNQTVQEFGLPESLYIPESHFGLFLQEALPGSNKDSPPGSGQGGPDQNGQESLKKVTQSGEVQPALQSGVNQVDNNGKNGGPTPHLPKVLTIAISPQKEVYLHFEQPFIFKPIQPGVDPWNFENGFQCQIFRVKGGSLDNLVAKAPEPNNLECLDSKHTINNWQQNRTSVFQFDNQGNVYYPGALPHSNKQVIYKKDRNSGQLSEVINANICVLDFLVTPNGGVFYTGNSSCQAGSGGDSGFFRYVAAGNQGVKEIARDWWNFIFEPLKATDSSLDKAVFFGPDPTNPQTASWDSACLFYFDPSKSSPTEQYSKAITCGSNIWEWMSLRRTEDKLLFNNYTEDQWGVTPPAGWLTEYKSRCLSEGQVFAGGGSQIKSVKQDNEGKVYVIGNVRRKNKGSVSCNLEFKGPHCTFNNIPALVATDGDDATTSTSCTDHGGTWVDKGSCWFGGESKNESNSTSCLNLGATSRWQYESVSYFSAVSDLCTYEGNVRKFGNAFHQAPYVDVQYGSTPQTAFQANQNQCQVATGGSTNGGPGSEWTSEYQGLASVDSTTKTLKLLSSPEEKALRLWIVDSEAFYSAYNVTLGRYQLRKYLKQGNLTETVLDNFETYNLNESPQSGKLMFDGLDFSNNQYKFGTISSSSPYETQLKSGLTGTVKTMVVFPK